VPLYDYIDLVMKLCILTTVLLATIGTFKAEDADPVNNGDSAPVMRYQWDAHQCADTYIIDWCESHKHRCKQGADFHKLPLWKKFEQKCKAEINKKAHKLDSGGPKI
jgi:hypothetical protein